MAEVAQVVFVRKRLPEVQYLRSAISDGQRKEFRHLIETTAGQIEAGHFHPHSGIRFPQNPCTSRSYLGLCLGKSDLIKSRLIRKPGATVGCFDDLTKNPPPAPELKRRRALFMLGKIDEILAWEQRMDNGQGCSCYEGGV